MIEELYKEQDYLKSELLEYAQKGSCIKDTMLKLEDNIKQIDELEV